LGVLNRHGFQNFATTAHAGKTINIERGAKRYGYINGSVLGRGGVVGYMFTGMGHPFAAVPTNSLEEEASRFCRRHAADSSDVFLQPGTGSNTGRGFLIIIPTHSMLMDFAFRMS
jgi:hypothetical protein